MRPTHRTVDTYRHVRTADIAYDDLPTVLLQPGVGVIARGRTRPNGRTTGGDRRCALEGCFGRRVGVRWTSGRITWPCTKGMAIVRSSGKLAWRIL
jgi:hypothetical protein